MLQTGGNYERALKSARRGATHRVRAPPGNLGLALMTKLAANKGVMLQAIAHDSPIASLVKPGWLLLDVAGVALAPGDYESAERLLRHSQASSTRILTLLDPEAEESLTSIVYEALSASWSGRALVTVEAPPGKLGIGLALLYGRPIVQALSADSPLMGSVGLRWEPLQVDDIVVSTLGHAEIGKLLMERASQEKRVLRFRAEEPERQPSLLLAVILLALLAQCVRLVFESRDKPVATPHFVENRGLR